MGDRYLETVDLVRATREYEALLGLQPEDPASARYGLAIAARAEGDRDAARRQVLQALEFSPFYRPAQRLLLELNEDEE